MARLGNLDDDLQYMRRQVTEGLDIVFRQFRLGNGRRAAAFFVDGLVNRDLLERDFFRPLMDAHKVGPWSMTELAEEVLNMASVQIVKDMDALINGALQGLTALLVDGSEQAILVEAISWQQRSINEPSTDVVIRGPREGFVETMRVNVSMMRRKIHHPQLAVESQRLGRYSQTDVAIIYIKGVVNEDVLTELKRRLKRIDTDAILDSGYIEQFIQDTPYSVFPTVGVTEKPDIAAARILEGRVLLLVDGSPVALTVPMLFVEGLQSSEDYYTRFYYASWLRILRVLAFLITVFLPGFYIAVTNYHHQLIPVQLMLSMVAAEARTPFSTGFSMLMIGIAYEILREAGVRLPRPAGQAVSIVGAIVMGEAAVSAGLISAPVLIVLAFTVIASYVSVTLMDAALLLRLIMIFLGWWMGAFGLLIGAMLLVVYLCSLESFGIPYFSPIAPWDGQGLRDSILRFPLFMLDKRPSLLSKNRRRMRPRRPQAKKFLFFLLIAGAAFTGGCWDQRQISDLAVVLGAGVDAPEQGDGVILTVELAHITTKNSEGEPQLFSAQGQTVTDALRNLGQTLDHQLHWSHLQMILIGERAARRGVDQYLSLFYNNKEMSPQIYFALCDGQAGQALAGRAGLSAYAAAGLHDILLKQRNHANGQVLAVSAQRFMSEHSLPRCGIAVPLVGRRTGEELDELYLKGMAVLDENAAYVGQLLSHENNGAALILGQVRPYALSLYEANMKQYVTVELTQWQIQYQWRFGPAPGQLQLTLSGKAHGLLIDEQESTHYSEQDTVRHLEELMSAELENQIKQAWRRTHVLNVDFLGLGRELYRKHPRQWSELLPNWPRALDGVELVIKIDSKVDVTGQSR